MKSLWKELLAFVWNSPSVGILGIALATVFFILNRRARIGPRLIYYKDTVKLIGGDNPALPNDVEISFGGQRIPVLSRTRIVIWNSGTATIDGAHVVTADPLRLVLSTDAQVLQASVIGVTRAVNAFRVDAVHPHVVNCAFDYLDAGDGAVIELLHTDREKYPKLEGSVRGIPKGPRDGGPLPPPRGRERRWGVTAGVSFIAFGAFLWAGELLWPEVFHTKLLPEWFEKAMERLFTFIFGLVFIALGIAALWITTRRLPEKLRGAFE